MHKKTLTNSCAIVLLLLFSACIKQSSTHNLHNAMPFADLVEHHLQYNDQAAPCKHPHIMGCIIEHETLTHIIIYRYQIEGREGDVVLLQNTRTNACYVVDFDDYITHGKDETNDAAALSEFICQAKIHYPVNQPSFDKILEAMLPLNYGKYASIAVGGISCDSLKKNIYVFNYK